MLHDSVRIDRWKTTVDPATAVCFARTIAGGTGVKLLDDAPRGAHDMAAHIDACTAAGAVFGSGSNPTYAHGLDQFEAQALAQHNIYAVDLWRFTYGDDTHATLSVVSQTTNHSISAHFTAGGRAFGNHLIAAGYDVSPIAIYTASRREYDAAAPLDTDTASFLLDPGTLPQYEQWCLDPDEIAHAVHVRTLRGPDLNNSCWARTEPGHDINLDTEFPSGVVHGVYNFTRA